MPEDGQDKQLVSAFSKPFGKTEGPQVFELTFNRVRHAEKWQEIAEQQATQLNIPIKICNKSNTMSNNAERYIFQKNEEERGEYAILVAVTCAEDYTRLCDALGPDLQGYIKQDNARTQAYLDHVFTGDGYQSIFPREAFENVKAHYWNNRGVPDPSPSVKTETNERTLTPSQQSLLDQYRADMNS